MNTLPVTVKGIVLHGNKLGRTIDMPTANIIPDIDISWLKSGVYYSRVTVGSKVYKAITNLGSKPTVKSDGAVNVESFLYDFSEDIYGREISVELLKFKRPEMRFESFQALSDQMHKDLEEGRLFDDKAPSLKK